MGTITRALGLLELFSEAEPVLGLSEIQRRTGRDKATTHRHLTALAEAGFLERTAGRGYRLGPALLRLAAMREATVPLARAVAPAVEAMSDELGELVHVSLLDGLKLTALYHADRGRHGVRVSFGAAETLELHATAAGLATLAFLGDGALRDMQARPLPALTPHTVTDPADLPPLLAEVQRLGLAVAVETMETGVAAMAAPLFGPHGRAAGALAVAFPVSRDTATLRERVRDALHRNAPTLTACLGGAVPEPLARAWAA